MGSAFANPTAGHTLWAKWVLQDGSELLQRDLRACVTVQVQNIGNTVGSKHR
jgi:hypothetical protein